MNRWKLSGILCAGLVGLTVSGEIVAFDPSTDPFAADRSEMVERQILGRGVETASVLRAMENVPRHFFVPEQLRERAYEDRPQSIGWGQTISQPYIVALMTELLELDGSERVLEIGTGSGYQAAVLSRLAREVYTIEILRELGENAKDILVELGYDNIHYRIGDGYQGWPEAAPFDAIIVTAAPPSLPQALVDQLKMGGRMVIPVGVYIQDLEVHTKTEDGLEKRKVIPVRFVPMVSEPGE
jgi:protein-L-isoaspartate(D-aspartate) O-methyltransferase